MTHVDAVQRQTLFGQPLCDSTNKSWRRFSGNLVDAFTHVMRRASGCTGKFGGVDGVHRRESESLTNTGEIGNGTLRDDRALLEENSVCRHALRLSHVVGSEDNGGAARREGSNDVADGVSAIDVHARGGFIKEDHFRVGGKGQGK